MKFFKLYDDVVDLSFATPGSACFDIRSYSNVSELTYYNNQNIKVITRPFGNTILIPPYCRMLIPTGLILDIPDGHSVRVFPRSGLSLKDGLTLGNGTGIIDSDYVNELFIILNNNTNINCRLKHGTRIAQAELIKNLVYSIESTPYKPSNKTSRIGGFGSTGLD